MKYLKTTIDQEIKNVILKKQEEKSFYYKDMAFSWKELDAIASKLAAGLLEMGIGKGDHIALWCQNSPFYLCALFAVCKLGGIAVLVNPSYKTWEIDQLVRYAQIKGIFCDDSSIRKLRDVSRMRFIQYIGMDIWDEIVEQEMPSETVADKIVKRSAMVSPEDFACMLFTSGTTGSPKGIELTHFQILNVAFRAAEAMHWKETDTICFSLPLFHSFGLSTGLLAAFYHRGKVCINSSYHSVDIMKCVEEHHCTVLNGVPTMFLSILYNPERKKYDLSSLNSGIIAGSGVYEKDFLTIARELKIPHLMQSYGQTEASPSITFSPYEDELVKRSQSTGKAIPGVEIRVRDLASGEILPPGEKGEVEIKGFNTMKGYYHLEAETDKVLRWDGWMRTGDIGSLDEEGYLSIYGRSKEMIIRGGENISPYEIEKVLLGLTGVRQVKVFGIPSPVIQEDIVACIVSDIAYDIGQVQNYVRKYLANYKIPRHVLFFDRFPENGNGKIDGSRLKNLAEQRILLEK